MGDGFLRWQVGHVRITRVVDDVDRRIGAHILPMATPEELRATTWLKPHYLGDDDELVLSVHALIVESEGQTIVVDTCLGNQKERTIEQWSMRSSPFLDELIAAGFETEAIDTVLCTHLHLDHVGFNTVKRGNRFVPTFRNARYLLAREEWEHWKDQPEDLGPVISDSVRPVFDAGQVDLVDMSHRLSDEVRLAPTPGHTPGHVSVVIESAGETAVITGDMIHHPCQIARPEWSSVVDTDREQSRRTRTEFLEQHADRPTLVIGTHFMAPTAGRIVRDGSSYRLEG